MIYVKWVLIFGLMVLLLEGGIYGQGCKVRFQKEGDIDGDETKDLIWICEKLKRGDLYLHIATQEFIVEEKLDWGESINGFNLVEWGKGGLGKLIKVILDRREEGGEWDYRGRVNLYRVDGAELVKIFSYEVYRIKSDLERERIEEVELSFKEVKGEVVKWIKLRKRRIERLYGKVEGIRQSHKDSVYRGEDEYYRYDPELRSYKLRK